MGIKVKARNYSCILLVAAIAASILFFHSISWGFAREVSEHEMDARLQVVETAVSWLGSREDDGSHHAIIDIYNRQEDLPRGYPMQYEDAWCATFASTVSIQLGFTDIIPTECSCEEQILLFDALGCWEEDDAYIPLPGDLIFYDWNGSPVGDSTGWADHVGIVVGTWGPFIKVIEGNKDSSVSYRYILQNDASIRGYGIPSYDEVV